MPSSYGSPRAIDQNVLSLHTLLTTLRSQKTDGTILHIKVEDDLRSLAGFPLTIKEVKLEPLLHLLPPYTRILLCS